MSKHIYKLPSHIDPKHDIKEVHELYQLACEILSENKLLVLTGSLASNRARAYKGHLTRLKGAIESNA